MIIRLHPFLTRIVYAISLVLSFFTSASALANDETPPITENLTVFLISNGTLACEKLTVRLTAATFNSQGVLSYTFTGPNGSITTNTTGTLSVSLPGTYSILVADDACNCTASATATVSSSLHPDYLPLVDFYRSTNGPGWTNKTGWLTNCDPCNGWYGVNCSNGRVSSIGLSNNNLAGILPNSLGTLTELTSLSFDNNRLKGKLPSNLATLPKLTDLFLPNNQFTGCIPASFSALCKRTSVILYNAGFSDRINWGDFCISGQGGDGYIGIAQASPQLACLGERVTLTAFPATGTSYTWAAPSEVIFNGPSTTASISATLITTNPVIFTVTIDGSCVQSQTVSVSGYIHPDYAPLVELYNATNGPNWEEKFGWGTDCNPCRWYGIDCLDGTGRVTSLNLYGNNLGGTIPASLSLLTNLTYLGFSGNPLVGNIPDVFGTLNNLEFISIANTQISGSIPASLGSLSKLQSLYLHDNQLTGNIPESFSALTSLRLLHLMANQLSGGVPSVVTSMTSLQYLYLLKNNLTGNIPSEISQLRKLVGFDLSYNQLSGTIPNSFSLLTNLVNLGFNNNLLSGCIPSSLSFLCGRYVNFSSNLNMVGGGNWQSFCDTGAGSSTLAIETIKNGSWHDKTTWNCGELPSLEARPFIRHIVTIDPGQTAQAFWVRYEQMGKLLFGTGSKLQLGQ